MTQQEVADRIIDLARKYDDKDIPATANLVARHERGVHHPSAVYLRQYRRLYGATDAELGFGGPVTVEAYLDLAEDTQHAARDEAVHRRDVLTLGVGTFVAGNALSDRLVDMFLTEAHAMSKTLDRPSHETSLQQYDDVADRLMAHQERHGLISVFPHAVEQFRAIRILLDEPQSVAGRRTLTRAAAKVGALLGLCAYDTPIRARTWFAVAQRAAAEAADGPSHAYALACESLLDFYAGHHHRALQALDAASQLVDHGVVAAIVASRIARVRATLGQYRETLIQLDTASRLLDRTSAQSREIYGFGDAHLAFYSATCQLRLGHFQAGEAEANRALRLYSANPHYMDPALIRLELAETWLTRNRPSVETAAATAQAVLTDLPVPYRTGPIQQRTADLASQFRNHGRVPAARDFLDFVATL